MEFILSVQIRSVQRPGEASTALRIGAAPHWPGDSPSPPPFSSSPKPSNLPKPRPGPRDQDPACARCPPLPTLLVGPSLRGSRSPLWEGLSAHSFRLPTPRTRRGYQLQPSPCPVPETSAFSPAPRRSRGIRQRGKQSPPPFWALAPLGHDRRRHFQTNAGAGGVALYGKNARE